MGAYESPISFSRFLFFSKHRAIDYLSSNLFLNILSQQICGKRIFSQSHFYMAKQLGNQTILRYDNIVFYFNPNSFYFATLSS